ncbi:hypothetical protein LTR53_009309 [Teratosphaeriaceae sp. CCFEE 6253]|nr:hypothetical protein LTR53_009309 [Teratosphaeriaceae sp. CCFEE 6253]
MANWNDDEETTKETPIVLPSTIYSKAVLMEHEASLLARVQAQGTGVESLSRDLPGSREHGPSVEFVQEEGPSDGTCAADSPAQSDDDDESLVSSDAKLSRGTTTDSAPAGGDRVTVKEEEDESAAH